MFTGIVREVGRVVSADGGESGRTLVVEAPETAASTAVGDSVSIGGVCLTAESVDAGRIRFHAVTETLRRTSLGRLAAGGEVNVEPALRAGEPLGGHVVQGHVDGLGRISSVEWEGDGLRVVVEASPEILRYCVEKGSITVDGVSLTVAELLEDAFAVALVPHTLSATTLRDLAPGQAVNLEVDVLAKYVERLLAPR
ncbi:riboflavin synthase [Gaiella sp.]|jgi:riboflavin synthase|uniref:riboflavin synthase n=1 Tax=Gaiella sp. TaxID=2663207 RepID=UPI002C8B0006|nr:riboflavin synthase [Gaiella sp.]HWO79428.1 riboflavin synthase [Gaiella sp.]